MCLGRVYDRRVEGCCSQCAAEARAKKQRHNHQSKTQVAGVSKVPSAGATQKVPQERLLVIPDRA